MINEGKTVTFNGQIEPKYGWAVIMAGGAGVGKTTSLRNHIPIHGKVVSSDYFKELYADTVNAEQSPLWKGKKIFSGNDVYLNGADKTHDSKFLDKHGKPFKRRSGEQIWNLRNLTDAGEINRVEGNGYEYSHNFLAKQRDNLLKGNINGKYLPNLIFDMAGAKGDTLEKTFEFLNSFKQNGAGYKVCLVWVVANRGVAYASMLNRDRIVPDDAFHKGHTKVNGNDGVLKTLRKYANDIDSAWMIFNSTFDETENGRVDRRLNADEKKNNVIELKKVNGKFEIPKTYNVMGKDNLSLSDIQGSSVAGMGRRLPKDDEDWSYKVFPTGKSAREYAKTHDGRYIRNVDVFSDEDNINKAEKERLERNRQGKLGRQHSSLVENTVITETQLNEIIKNTIKNFLNENVKKKR